MKALKTSKPPAPETIEALRTGDTRPGSGNWEWCVGRRNAVFPEDGPCRVIATVNTIGALRAGLDPQAVAKVMASGLRASLVEPEAPSEDDARARVYRFGDRVAAAVPGEHGQAYLQPDEARALAAALLSFADDIDNVGFAGSTVWPATVRVARPGLHD